VLGGVDPELLDAQPDVLAVEALSLSFFFTDFGARSAMPFGRTLQQATMNPASSSTAKRARAMSLARGTPE
jgi:hypothetical protein